MVVDWVGWSAEMCLSDTFVESASTGVPRELLSNEELGHAHEHRAFEENCQVCLSFTP